MLGDARRMLVTGSNGHLGRRLIAHLRQTQPDVPLRALVRSQRAADMLDELPKAHRPHETVIADYADSAGLERATSDCRSIIHLVGIIKENANTSYAMAHEGTCRAIAAAAAATGVEHIVYLSLFGASANSSNACLASRGRAEEILLGAPARATIMQVPMVLGRGDDAARALGGMSSGSLVPLMGGGSTLQQPIDARDVVLAMASALSAVPPGNRALCLGGPESLTHRELILRAAAITGGSPRFIKIPFAIVRGLAAVLERLAANPPMTRAWLGVLQHDDRVDATTACEELGIELTPLDETLRHCLADESNLLEQSDPSNDDDEESRVA